MTPAKTVARLRRLAGDWRREEERLCAQYGSEVAPRSMRARRTADAKAIDAAITLIEHAESDIATAEQDSRQKQARIERLTEALSSLVTDLEVRATWRRDQDQRVVACGNSVYVRAKAALEESK